MEDRAGENWMAGIAREWHDDLADERQDIYSLTDGTEPIETDEEIRFRCARR